MAEDPTTRFVLKLFCQQIHSFQEVSSAFTVGGISEDSTGKSAAAPEINKSVAFNSASSSSLSSKKECRISRAVTQAFLHPKSSDHAFRSFGSEEAPLTVAE
eukprot:TRINITY_DN5009_c0_g3_i1.p1 TRINITY_DN5009_c0_g3~~TRINITY_DN5009_c0_g3_i1.p1  ORF type:complete len:102 (-),score=19.04 TRINITY_DN5009_c0_g3_i1:723-1028(-)